MACLTAEVGMTNLLYYPHTDSKGHITSTSVMEVSPYQRYLIEKKAREVLGKEKKLDVLYPDKKGVYKGNSYTVKYNTDGSIVCSYDANGKVLRTFKKGLPDFPVGSKKVNIYYDETTTNATAYYTDTPDSFVACPNLIERINSPPDPNRLSPRETALLVGRHELNHALWKKIPEIERKKIMDSFSMDNSLFKQFVDNLLTQDVYVQGAQRDLVDNPSAEYLEVTVGGKPIKIGKERIVNELLAYATWDEVVDGTTASERLTRIGLLKKIVSRGPHGFTYDDSAVQYHLAAQKCLEKLPDPVKKKIRSHELAQERGSASSEAFKRSFNVALAIINGELH